MILVIALIWFQWFHWFDFSYFIDSIWFYFIWFQWLHLISIDFVWSQWSHWFDLIDFSDFINWLWFDLIDQASGLIDRLLVSKPLWAFAFVVDWSIQGTARIRTNVWHSMVWSSGRLWQWKNQRTLFTQQCQRLLLFLQVRLEAISSICMFLLFCKTVRLKSLISAELQKYFPLIWEPGKRENNCLRDESIVYNNFIQYTIGLQLYLLKRFIDKVTESGFQAIKVSGDVQKWIIVFRKVCQSLKVLHLMHSL